MPGRNSIKGKARVATKHKNERVTYEQRLAVIRFRETASLEETINHFPFLNGTARSERRKLDRWRSDRANIEVLASHHRTKRAIRKRLPGSATIFSVEQEKTILLWINNLRKDGIPVSSIMLHIKACDVATKAGIVGFRGSWSWRRGFLQRHRLSIRMRTRQGQVNGVEADAARLRFAARVRELIHKYRIVKVYNADQTAVNFEYVPKQTIDEKGVKTVWLRCTGKDKERLTAMLLGDMDGEKYTPIAVVKARSSTVPGLQDLNNAYRNGFGRRLWGEVAPIMDTTDLMIYGNPKGWWNEDLSLAFLNFHFGGRSINDHPVLLLWDDMSAHWTPKVKAYAASKQVLMEKVPPHYTFCCQPADVAWNRPLKDRLRASWVSHMRASIETTGGVQPPKRDDVLQWLHDAWQGLSSSTIANGFRRCGFDCDVAQPQMAAESELIGGAVDDELYGVLLEHSGIAGAQFTISPKSVSERT